LLIFYKDQDKRKGWLKMANQPIPEWRTDDYPNAIPMQAVVVTDTFRI